MAGDSGTGKTTLARAIGKATGALVLDKDVYKAWILEDALGDAANGQAYVALHATASMAVAQGLSVVLDSPAYFPRIIERGQSLADGAGASYFLIELVCSAREEQERRLRSRAHREFQPGSLIEATAMAQRPGVVALADPHLTIDTNRDFGVCLAEALSYLEGDAA
jgi:predicted kinase